MKDNSLKNLNATFMLTRCWMDTLIINIIFLNKIINSIRRSIDSWRKIISVYNPCDNLCEN